MKLLFRCTFVKWSCAKFKYLIHSANWWKQMISSASITEDIFESSIDPISWMVWCHGALLKWSCSLWSTEKAKRSIYTASGGESEAARGRKRKHSQLKTDPSENKHSLHYCHFKSGLSGGSWETFLSAVLLSVFSARITFALVWPRCVSSRLFTPLRFHLSHISFGPLQQHRAATRCTATQLIFLSHLFQERFDTAAHLIS